MPTTEIKGLFRLAIGLLAVYGLVVFPLCQFFLRHKPWLKQPALFAFLVLSLLLILIFHKTLSLKRLGWSWPPLSADLGLGSVLGGMLILGLPSLNGFLQMSGLDQHELLAGASARNLVLTNAPPMVLGILLYPFIKQTFFIGFVGRALAEKLPPVLWVYLAGLLFALSDFSLTLGQFVLGILCAWLYKKTNRLYAPYLLHVCAMISWELLIRFYGRLATLLGFLF